MLGVKSVSLQGKAAGLTWEMSPGSSTQSCCRLLREARVLSHPPEQQKSPRIHGSQWPWWGKRHHRGQKEGVWYRKAASANCPDSGAEDCAQLITPHSCAHRADPGASEGGCRALPTEKRQHRWKRGPAAFSHQHKIAPRRCQLELLPHPSKQPRTAALQRGGSASPPSSAQKSPGEAERPLPWDIPAMPGSFVPRDAPGPPPTQVLPEPRARCSRFPFFPHPPFPVPSPQSPSVARCGPAPPAPPLFSSPLRPVPSLLPRESESSAGGSRAPRSAAPGLLHVGATMASSISSLFRRSLRRPGRRESKQEAPAADSIPSRVPLGKAGERSSVLYSAGQFFFEYLVVVSLKKMSDGRYEPKIAYQFPKRENLLKGQKEEEERLLQAIPLFCFPDGNNWEPVTTFPSETFSFVLTNVDGSRKIGYCRRLLPSGRGVRLPEVFCIISCLGCFGLFSKILDEVEKRRQISMAVIYPFMQGLRESPFPAPGKTVTIKSFIPESGTELIELTRPVDAHLEHVEFPALLQRLSPILILHIFASAVLERRLIFLAEELSVLSQCIHAVAALLYPFTWAHTYIPVVPECLLDTVCCPTPFMVGIQMRHLERVLEQPMEEALIVDLCEGKILRAVGDEEEILPIKLQNEMLASLNRHNSNNNVHTSEQLNALISEAFVQFFVRLVGHYPSHIKWSKNGLGTFQERAFCKAIASKTNRRFVKKFVKTNMFSLFIEDAEKSRIPQEAYFQQKITEYHQQKKHRRDS